MEVLDLSGNGLTDSIPAELGELKELRTLDLSRNSLTSEIPDALGRLTNLQSLRLNGNELTGELPKQLGGLTKLQWLELSNNELTGEIPPELGNMTSLDWLSLGSNQLTGEITRELSQLPRLRVLWLSYNQLTGSIPAALGQLRTLEELDLGNNELTGGIPEELGELANLKKLILLGIELSGPIPEALRRLNRLELLWLQRNRLTGEVPAWLGTLSQLTYLNLGENQLTGEIPASLGDLTNLQHLSLGDNELSGKIPPELGYLSSLESLDLTGNQLVGGIPVELGGLATLQSLALRKNQIEGEIPSVLGSLSNLRYLYLGGNRLTGEVPETLGELTELVYLELYGNRLTGEFPETLGKLENILGVWLQDNDLTGCVPTSFITDGDIHIDNTGLKFCFAVDDASATVASPALLTVAEHNALTIEESVLLANDIETTNYALRILRVGDAANGRVSLDGSAVIYRHDGSETATGSFTYTAGDGVHESTALVTLAVTPVNDPPVAFDDNAALEEGGILLIEARVLISNDADAESDELKISAIGNTDNGRLLLDGTAIIYVHDGSETTADSFTYTVTDGMDTGSATVTLTVTPVNDPPVALDDDDAVQEGAMLSIQASTLLANDTDAENNNIRISAVGTAVNGTVSLDGTTVTYEHDGSETSTDSFTYTVSDGTYTDSATVMLTVTPVNDPPLPLDDAGSTEEGGILIAEVSVLLANDTDAEDDPLKVSTVGDAVNGNVSLDGSIVIYEHDGSETTTGSFTYTLSDSIDTGSATMTVTVTPVNDHPVALDDNATLEEGGTLSIEASTLLANDTDAENNVLKVSAVGDAVNGTVMLGGLIVTYEHDGSETITGSFTYTVSDGIATGSAIMTVNITPVNDPPLVLDDDATLEEGGTLSIESSALLANDTDAENDVLKVSVVGVPVNGTVMLDDATVTYEHDGSETTTASFTYTVSDGIDTRSATVAVNITPVNDPPVAVDDTASLEEGATLMVEASILLANDTDEEGDTLQLTEVGAAVNGVVSLDGATITFEHDGSETTIGSFTYVVSDGADDASGSVMITVTLVADLPFVLWVALVLGVGLVTVVVLVAIRSIRTRQRQGKQ